MIDLVLASASPRRRALLAAAGVSFSVIPADVDETPRPGERPRAYALRVATDKARAVAARAPGRPCLGADTVVALGARVLGKPPHRDAAIATLRALSGVEHRVTTAVVLLCGHDAPRRIAVTTRVRFRPLSDAEIDAYVDTGEPFDKAGGYGIQGGGGALVDRVVGSWTNVVGLPLRETLALLDACVPPEGR